MSRATRQSTAIISIIGGCLYEIDKENMLSRLDMKELVRDTYKDVIHVLKEWPTNEDDKKVIKWVNTRIDEWELHIRTVKNYLRLVVLSKICELCLYDLIGITKNKYKLQMLEGIKDPINKIAEFADREGENTIAYKKAEELLYKFYDLIEFEY